MSRPRIPSPPLGWPLLPVPRDGALHYPSLEDSVRQNIRVILLTRPGEQLMRPQYGAGLDQYLHDPNTLTTRRRIRDTVVQSITRWESRLVLDRVDVWPIEGRADAVRVEIAYRLKRTGVSETMKLTMSLGS